MWLDGGQDNTITGQGFPARLMGTGRGPCLSSHQQEDRVHRKQGGSRIENAWDAQQGKRRVKGTTGPPMGCRRTDARPAVLAHMWPFRRETESFTLRDKGINADEM
jgi:hypothetical protein